MDLENIMLSEIRQSEKDKYHMISLNVESNEQNKLMNKIETEAWKHETYRQLSEGNRKGGLDERR